MCTEFLQDAGYRSFRSPTLKPFSEGWEKHLAGERGGSGFYLHWWVTDRANWKALGSRDQPVSFEADVQILRRDGLTMNVLWFSMDAKQAESMRPEIEKEAVELFNRLDKRAKVVQ